MGKIYKIRDMRAEKNKNWRDFYEAPFECRECMLLTAAGNLAAFIDDDALMSAVCSALNGEMVTYSGEHHGAKYHSGEQEVRGDDGDTICDIRGYSWLCNQDIREAEADAIVDAFGEAVAEIINKLGEQ